VNPWLVLVAVGVSGFGVAGEVWAGESATLDLTFGVGTTSTSWVFPPAPIRDVPAYVTDVDGGEVLSVRALFTVPVTPGLSVLFGGSLMGIDHGELDGRYTQQPLGFMAREKVHMAEFGLRIRL